MKTVIFYNIQWDADNEIAMSELPDEVTFTVANDFDIDDFGADLLSDKYGFLVNGFNYEVKK